MMQFGFAVRLFFIEELRPGDIITGNKTSTRILRLKYVAGTFMSFPLGQRIKC